MTWMRFLIYMINKFFKLMNILSKSILHSTIVTLIFFNFIFCISCSDNSPTEINTPRLKLLFDTRIFVDEPSGLCLSLDAANFWTVSDKTKKVYKVDFEGQVLKTLSYRGYDPEGIAIDPKDSTLWIVEEDSSFLVQLDTLGNLLNSIYIPGSQGDNGLEGITINTSNGHFFLLKEQNPGVLIELDTSFTLLSFKRINFAFDFSGIFYESSNNHLWIVSDQSEIVFKCDINGQVLTEYPIDVRKAEGIAVDNANKRIYIVSDAYERLYCYSIIE